MTVVVTHAAFASEHDEVFVDERKRAAPGVVTCTDGPNGREPVSRTCKEADGTATLARPASTGVPCRLISPFLADQRTKSAPSRPGMDSQAFQSIVRSTARSTLLGL